AASGDANTVADRHLGQIWLDVDPLGEVQGAVRLEGDRGNWAMVDRREPTTARPRIQDRSHSVVIPLAARSNARLIEEIVPRDNGAIDALRDAPVRVVVEEPPHIAAGLRVRDRRQVPRRDTLGDVEVRDTDPHRHCATSTKCADAPTRSSAEE